MDYEKAYKEALEIAKKLYEQGTITEILSNVFPELAESEDERMRKELIKETKSSEVRLFETVTNEKFIAWLEKQGKHRSCDSIELKFKVGDWVVFNNKHQSIYHVEKIENGYYILRHTHGGRFRVCVLHDECLRPWAIADAKDGDVLATDISVFIYAKVLYSKPHAYCGVDKYGDFKDNCLEHNWANSVDNIHPATKEQRDKLFQKMKEAGYEWNPRTKKITYSND